METNTTLFRISEVAERLALSEPMVRILIKRGDLKAVRIGTAVRVTSDALEEYIELLRDESFT